MKIYNKLIGIDYWKNINPKISTVFKYEYMYSCDICHGFCNKNGGNEGEVLTYKIKK